MKVIDRHDLPEHEREIVGDIHYFFGFSDLEISTLQGRADMLNDYEILKLEIELLIDYMLDNKIDIIKL